MLHIPIVYADDVSKQIAKRFSPRVTARQAYDRLLLKLQDDQTSIVYHSRGHFFIN